MSKAFSSVGAAILAGTTGTAAAILVAGAMITVAPGQADATPQYSQQTKLPCGQCHENAAGSGKLKSFGERFKAKGHKL